MSTPQSQQSSSTNNQSQPRASDHCQRHQSGPCFASCPRPCLPAERCGTEVGCSPPPAHRRWQWMHGHGWRDGGWIGWLDTGIKKGAEKRMDDKRASRNPAQPSPNASPNNNSNNLIDNCLLLVVISDCLTAVIAFPRSFLELMHTTQTQLMVDRSCSCSASPTALE